MDIIRGGRVSEQANEPAGDSTLEGYVDRVGWDGIVGWIRDTARPASRLTVDVLVDGALAGSAVAEDLRADLLAAGKGDGRHGFILDLPPPSAASPVVQVTIRERSSGFDLAGAPIRLVNDDAGLDPHSRAYIANKVGRVVQSGDGALLDELAVFLLAQIDRLLTARMAAAERRSRGLDHLAQLLEQQGCNPASGVGAVISLIRDRYGGPPLALPTSDMPEISVVIPVRDFFGFTHRCLAALVDHAPRRTFEVILSDDGSVDETLLAPLLVTGIRIVRRDRSEGFVGATGQGAAVARGRLLLLLNNDTEVTAGALDALADTFDRDASIGVAGAALLFPDGRLQECGGAVGRGGEATQHGRGQDPDRPEFRHLRDVGYVSGAALMIRRELWQRLDGLAQEFAPGYYEDADLCFRAQEAGYRVVVQPGCRIVHHEGVSAGTDVNGPGMKRHQRGNRLRFAERWTDRLRLQEAGLAPRRALFIDESVPTPDRDAGSAAAVSHMQSLLRLGYLVHFVPASTMARIPPYTGMLEQHGIYCHAAPYEVSAEDVLRRHAGRFEVIYLHRLAAARLAPMARALNLGARILYSVADLHHLRLAREAGLAGDAGLRRRAQMVRLEELAGVAEADCTIVHSQHEARVLHEAAPGTPVAVIAWSVPVRPAEAPFGARQGVALVGSTHPPNLDGAEWLVQEVMPLVWERAPSITLTVLGTMCGDARVRRLAEPRVRLAGWVPDLAAALGEVRLTVAPLRFGAGLKGKVLDSMAAGLPCVMTGCAAEGAALPGELEALVSDDARGFADLIIALHEDADRNGAASAAGLAHVRGECSEARIDALLRAAISSPLRPRAQY